MRCICRTGVFGLAALVHRCTLVVALVEFTWNVKQKNKYLSGHVCRTWGVIQECRAPARRVLAFAGLAKTSAGMNRSACVECGVLALLGSKRDPKRKRHAVAHDKKIEN